MTQAPASQAPLDRDSLWQDLDSSEDAPAENRSSSGGGGQLKAVAGIVLLAGLAGVVAMRFFASAGGVGEEAFYFDESGGELFVADAGLRPPIRGVIGNEVDGVRAIVYVAGADPSVGERRIAYLQTFTDELKAEYERWDAGQAEGRPVQTKIDDRVYVSDNTLVRTVDDPTWHPSTSAEGRAIKAVLTRRAENGQFPTIVDPSD